ncbi:MAG: protein kinase, partial [Pseudomonadota bacterium]
IHRDIKPQNIMLVSIEGNPNFVKILDFGLARTLVELPGQSKLTVQGTIMGTPQYMAPEQVMGSKDIDHRADLYAVGVILFEMVTQQEAFIGDNMRAVLTNKINPDYDPFRSISAAPMPPAIEVFLRKVLSIQPDKRYFSSSEMKEALQEAVEKAEGAIPQSKEAVGFAPTMEMPVYSIPPGPMAAREAPRAQQVDVVTLGKSKVVTTQSSGTIESRPSEVYGRKKSRAAPVILIMLLLAAAAVAGYFFVLPRLVKTSQLAQGAPDAETVKAGTLTTGTETEEKEEASVVETAEKEGGEIIDIYTPPPGLEGEPKKKEKKKGKKEDETAAAAEEVKEPPPVEPPKIEIEEPPPDLPKKPSKADISKVRKELKNSVDGCAEKLFGTVSADIVFQGKTGSVMDVANQFWGGNMGKGKGCILSQMFQVKTPPFAEEKFVVAFSHKFAAKIDTEDGGPPVKEESGTGLKMMPMPELTNQAINSAIQKQKLKKKLEACAGGQTGTVVIKAVVDGSGKVTSAEIVGDFAGTGAEACMLKAVKGLKFPESMRLETQVNKTIQVLE